MLLWVVLVTPFLYRLVTLGQTFAADEPLSHFYLFLNDIAILLALVCLLGNSPQRGLMRGFFTLLALLLYLYYVVDIAVILLFSTRLYWQDALHYGGQVSHAVGMPVFLLLLASLALIAALFWCHRLIWFPRRKRSATVFSCVVCAGFLLSVAEPIHGDSSRAVFFRNVYAANWLSTEREPYSQSFIDSLNYNDGLTCTSVEPARPDNIYVVLVESWSRYHSGYFMEGGQPSWTPQLDALAAANHSLLRLFSNGFTTEASLYAIFTGQLPLFPQTNLSGKVSLAEVSNERSVLLAINAHGYHSQFITSGDLNFLDKASWLSAIGFQTLLDSDDFDYQGQRLLFDSPPDALLLKKVEALHGKRDQFVVIENVTTHSPYYYPDASGRLQRGEEEAFGYSDRWLATLIQQIAVGNNLVIVMSDHRTMSRVTASEAAQSGRMAAAAIPGFVYWQGKQRVIDAPIQHTDILPSLVDWLAGKQCSSDFRGALFPLTMTKPANCQIYVRGDDRSRVTAQCRSSQFDVRLAGDNTRALEDNDWSQRVVDFINATRSGKRRSAVDPSR
ncbi:LTA synthase family protein [Thaumasiovibrio subtropicus]|nr:sulfatase-like hydrolase/transferase [Thaumasiovibrio subtropicus]